MSAKGMQIADSSSSSVKARDAAPLHWQTKIVYGIGDIANALKTTILGLFTLFFYTTVMGLPATLVGIAAAIGVCWDAVIDPYIGYLSDHSRRNLGQRHSFMLVGASSMGLGFWAFFSPPLHLPTALLFFWLLGTNILVRTTTSLFTVPYFALGAELSDDYHERTSIVAIRAALALIGTLLAAALCFIVFFPDTTPGVDPKLDYASYPAMGAAFGVTMTLVAIIATAGTLRAGASVRRPQPAIEHWTFRTNFVRSLRNGSFRVLFTSFSLFFFALVVNSALLIHYLTHYAQVTASVSLSTFQLIFYAMSIAGVLCWMFVSKLVEKQWLYITAALTLAALMLGAYLLIGKGSLLGTGNVAALAIGQGLGGFFGSIVWFIPHSMIADVVDEDELATGRRREAHFFGIFFMGQQLAAAASVLVTGVLIEWFAGLQPGQVYQSVITGKRIGMLYGGLPATLLIIAAAISLRYQLNRPRVEAIQRELARRHEKA